MKKGIDPLEFGGKPGLGVEHFGRSTLELMESRGSDGGLLPDGP